MSKTHFDRLTMILRSTGFLTSKLIRSQNAVNFAYILYLRGRAEQLPADDLERLVRRWYAMSILTRRYSGSPETAFDLDIRQIEAQGLQKYVEAVIENELPATYWTGMLPQLMDTLGAKPLLHRLPSRPGPPRRPRILPQTSRCRTCCSTAATGITCSHASTCRSKA